MNITLFEGIPDYAQDFLHYKKNIQAASNRTVQEYYQDLHIFFRFVADYKHLTTETEMDKIDGSVVPLDVIRNITLSDIYIFLSYVADERSNKARARARKISSLRGFYKYLERQALIDKNPTETLQTPKLDKNLPIYLTIDESVRLLNSIDGKYKTRDYCIITLFLHCGLRLSEMANLNLSSISGNCLRVTGKGNKQRELFLNETCIDVLNNYLEFRRKIVSKSGHENALFLSQQRSRITPRMIEVFVKKYMEKAGLDITKFSTHKLRHTAATLMFQSGVDIRVLQDVLGHENLGTTQIYTHIGDKQIEDALMQNPLNKKDPQD